jgi:hypothetical protein
MANPTELAKAAQAAIARFDLATASGSPSAIGAARAELLDLKKKLEASKIDGILAATMASAVRKPVRLGQ